jgi:ribosomal protein S18 acetylase RimI-like enzyme
MSNPMQQESSDFSIVRILHYWSQHFREAMQIYHAEFPVDSRLSVAKIRTLLKAGQYQLFVTQEQGTVLGFALIWISHHPAFVHLDYIAVRQEQKGRGIGTLLYRWLTAHLQELCPRASLLTLEVDDELIPFYRRSDTDILAEVPYLFPGRFGPLPMHLMVYDRQRRKTLPRTLVQGVIRALYQGLHHRPAGDPLLRSFLPRVPQSVRLV